MRIAFSGTHRAGKTSLLEAVASELAGYGTVDEPYHLLEEEGYEHADPPSLEDFEAQLERSTAALADNADARDVLFDRCPADVLAYLLAHESAEDVDPADWIDRVRDALSALELVVFVPVERPDRIALPAHESKRYRRRVHERLEQMWLDDAYDFGVEVLVVEGDLSSRVAAVLQRVRATP